MVLGETQVQFIYWCEKELKNARSSLCLGEIFFRGFNDFNNFWVPIGMKLAPDKY